jgi:GNAT superfamily N-acetyltransferase
MNQSFEIVKVTKDNYHLYDDLVYLRLNGKERSEKEKEVSKTKIDLRILKELKKDVFFVYAALVENKFVGWIHALYIPKIGKWTMGIMYIDELWVSSDFRRKGIATALIKKVIEIKDDLGIDCLRVYTDNKAAKNLYEKCGLHVINESFFIEGKF